MVGQKPAFFIVYFRGYFWGLFSMLVEEKISGLILPSLSSLGFRLIRVSFGDGRLQIMAEPLDFSAMMTVEDCAKISRQVSAVLDVEDPISAAYRLEVSSPGLSRPLVSEADFVRFRGELVKVSSRILLDGRRRFQGRLVDFVDDCVCIETVSGIFQIPFGDIESARLDPSEFFMKPFSSRERG